MDNAPRHLLAHARARRATRSATGESGSVAVWMVTTAARLDPARAVAAADSYIAATPGVACHAWAERVWTVLGCRLQPSRRVMALDVGGSSIV